MEFGIVTSAIMIYVKSVLIDIGICISWFFIYEISYFQQYLIQKKETNYLETQSIYLNTLLKRYNFYSRYMEYQGMDFERFSRYERDRAGTEFPRVTPKLCSSLVDLSINELIQNIITLKERENISDLLKAVKAKQNIERGRDLLEVFKEKFTQRLQECYNYFQSQGLNMENQIQSQFFEALQVIFRKMVDQISSTFFQKIWNVLRTTKNFQVFHKVSSVLTSIVLYPSIKKFDKPAIKLTNGILQTIKGHLKQLKTSEQFEGDRIKILEEWNNLSEQEKLILHFHLVRLYQMLEKGQEETEWKQHLEGKLIDFIKENQCQLLLRTLSKFPNLCKKIYEDLGAQLLKCTIDIEGKQLKLNKNLLTKKMVNFQTIEIMVGKHNLPQKIISDLSIVKRQDKFYTYLNIQALQTIANNIENQNLVFSIDALYTNKNMVNSLLETKNLQIFVLREESWVKILQKQFVCKLIKIFVKQLYLAKTETKSSELQTFYENTFVQLLFTTLFQWFQSEQQRKRPYAKLVLSDLISYSSFYIHRQNSKENEMKQFLISKSMEMVQLFGQILKDWRTIKHGRYLLQFLAQDTNAPIEKTKCLTDVLLDALFSRQFRFTRKSFYHFLQQKRPSEAYIQYFSQYILKKVQQFNEQITKEQNFAKNQQKIQQANQFLFKVSTLILGNFKLTNAYQISEILANVYLKFGQSLNQIYPLRSWIIHYKVPVQDIGVLELVKSIRDQIKQSDLLSKKDFALDQYFKNELLKSDDLKKINDLLQKMSRVQNFLDLKQPSLNLESQVYQIVLESILLPFSDWCTSAYIKSAQKIIQSEEMAKEVKNIVVSSLFRKQQSLYAKINSVLIKMSLTLRIYLCNPGVSFNYGQINSLSRLLGKLIIRLPQLDTNITKKLSLFRLFTTVSGLQFDELKSHLTVDQVIEHSLAYRGLAVNLRKNSPPRLSLNIAIPMLNATKEHLEQLIVLMTPDKRKQSPSISLCSHFLSGNKLLEVCEKVSKKDKRINDLIKNQASVLSRTILSNLFLPQIKTPLPNQEKIGLSYYLRQIRIIFESKNCEGFVQDHIDKILRIFKNKNSSKFSMHIRENNQVEPSNFSQYGIQPMEFRDFKIEVTKIVKTFLNTFASIFYNEKSDNLIKSLESTIKFVKQIESFSVKQEEKLSTEEMLIKLLQRGYEIFKKFIAENGQNSQSNQIQQNNINSNPEQGQITNQDDDIQARRAQIYRLMRLRQQRKFKPSKSKLFSLFNVLAQVEKSKPNLVKKCFQIGMQVELLKFLPIANKGNAYQVTEICDFIGQTLPSFEAEGDQSQLNQTILYYKAILYSLEKLKLTNLDCINQLCIKLVKEAKNSKSKSTSDFWEELVNRISCIAFKCFELPNKMGRQKLSDLVYNIMRVNTDFSKSITQFEVKNYIITQFQKATFTQVKDVSKYSLKSTILPDWIQLFIKQFKNRFSSRIENQGREFYQVVRQLIKGWRKSNQTIVYTDGLAQLSQFKGTEQSFLGYTVPQKTKAFLTQIVQSFSKVRVEGSRLVIERVEKVSKTQSEQQKENITKEFYQKVTPISKNIFNYLQVLENIFEKCQLVIPFVLQVPVKNMDGNVLSFLDFLIEFCINEKIDSIIRFVTLLLCKNGLYANYVDQITYSQYVSARILKKIIESLKKYKGNLQMINQIIYFASVCLGVKVFNSMSSLPVSQDNKESLLSVIEGLLNQKQQDNQVKNPIKLLYQQCHYLMNRHRHVEKIKKKNCLIQTNEDNQFIHKQLFEIGQEQDSMMKRFTDSDSGSDSEWEVKQQSSSKIILSKYVQKSISHQKLNGYSWNNLDHCVISLEKQIRDEKQFFNSYTPMFSIVSQEQNTIIYQIDGQKIAQFYQNFDTGTKQEGKKKQFFGRRRQQTRKFMIYTRPVTSISELRAFYKKLIHLLPASKYVVPKKEEKYKNLEAEILDDESFETLRTELNYLRQGQAQRNMFIGTHFSGSRDQDLNQSRKIQEFICMLQSIKQNSEQFTEQGSPKKKTEALNIQDAPIPLIFKRSSSVTENNIMEVNQVVSAESEPQQIVDLKQQNYRKLQAMNFSQRFQFLTNEADDHYFQNLPSQVSTEIREQAQLLTFQKQRIEAQKQRIARRRQMYGQDYYQYSRKRRNKKKAIPRLLHQPLSAEEQVDFKQETVQSILKCLFIKALIKNSQSRSESAELGCGKGINLLLETKRNDTKFRVLNFLIILIKKLEKLKVAYFFKDEGQWKHQFKAEKKTIEQSQKKFVVQILDSIKSSLDKCLFNNDELVCKPLLKQNFYKNVLSEQIDNQSLFQVALGADGQFYNPLNELLNISLDYNHELMTSLMKRSKELPEFLIRKIFDLIGQNKIKCQSLYDNLQILSSNPLLTELFKTKYSKQTPPSFQMLGKVLKYEFAKIPCAKELHEKALKQYKKSYNQYLIQVLRQYSKQELMINSELKKYKQIYCNIIENLYKSGQNIKQSPIYSLVGVEQFLDYKSKLAIFRSDPIFQNLNSWTSDENVQQLFIDLNEVFASSYNQIMRLQPEQIRKKISVKFLKSTSRGIGIIKPLIQKIYVEMFKNSQMFIPIENLDTYQPSKYAVYSNQDYLNCYKFLGRILALCIFQDLNFPAFFTKTFYKMLLNIKPDWKDLKQVNKDVYEYIQVTKNMYKENPAAKMSDIGVDLYYYYKGKDILKRDIQYEFKQNGKNIVVTNFEQYVELATKSILIDFCDKEYEKIKEGFNQVLPLEKLSIFSPNDLQKLISGLPDIDKKQFKEVCKYKEFNSEDQEVLWFWKYVDECNRQQMSDLLQYFYGMSKLPAEGFKNINVQILKIPGIDTLPRASLCFGITIKLPKYTSYQKFTSNLHQAISQAKKGDGFMEG